MRKILLTYIPSPETEWATLETADGYYICEIHRCSGESVRTFRKRARSLQAALSRCPGPLLTTQKTPSSTEREG